ncbi:MAG: SAM-dependent methyltransferase, partial [Eubacteriales bacterium]
KALSEMARVLKKGGQLIGCTYIKGAYGPTDFVVNLVLARKGWFNPPFYTKEKLEDALKRDYRHVEVSGEKAIAEFKCTK